MRLEYSPIGDLYGVQAERRRPKEGSNTWLIIMLVIAGAFVLESIRPVKHLRADPPSDFVLAQNHVKGSQRSAQRQVARSYWDTAVDFLQQSYPFGSTLPNTPPSNFTVQNANESGLRAVYWEKLREIWKRPEVWNTSFEWNTDWIQKEYEHIEEAANSYLDR